MQSHDALMNKLHQRLVRQSNTLIEKSPARYEEVQQFNKMKTLPNKDSSVKDEKIELHYELLPPKIEEESKSCQEYEVVQDKESAAPSDNILIIHSLPQSFSNISDILGSTPLIEKSPTSETNQQDFPVQKSPFLENDEALLNLVTDDYADLSSVSYQAFRDKVQNNKEFVERILKIIGSPGIVFTHLLNKCRILMKTNYAEMFEEEISLLVNLNHEDISEHTIKKLTKVNFDEFSEACLNWFKSLRYSNALRESLKKSVKHYSEINQDIQGSDDSKFINSLLNKLKRQIKRLNVSPKANPKAQTFEESAQAGITEIFNYYSKQQFLLGKSPTFEAINKNLEILTLSKFLYFCKDFGLIQSKSQSNKNRTKISQVHDIFKKNSDFVRDMHLYQFSQSLSDIAEIYFTEEYDVENHTNFSKLTPEKKTLKLYEILDLHKPQLYTKKLVGALSHFGNQPSRMPDDDLSKKYKLRHKKIAYLNSSLQIGNRGIIKRSHLKHLNSIEDTRKNDSYVGGKPLTISSLTKLNKEDFDLGDIIDEKSSDEEFYKTLNKSKEMSGLGNSISMQALQRASELTRSVKQLEELKVDKATRLVNRSLNRSVKYAAKYRNK